MAMQPVYNPAVPSKIDINGMFVGKSIYVYGVAKPNANKFGINLQCGPGNNADMALHFNPRFNENQIVRNTRQNQGWGKEERGGGDFPFQRGQPFGITITCRQTHFEVKANRCRVFATYNHRIPLSSVTHLSTGGDCEIKMVAAQIEGLECPVQILNNPQSPGGHIKVNHEIPFHNIRDRTVTIIGKPTNDNGKFSINLESDQRDKNHFHMNPRLGAKELVRNTLQGGNWGSEERGVNGTFPFVAGVPFQIKIRVTRRQYEVELNGSKLLDYGKRLGALKNIRRLVISGEVDVEKVVFA